VVTPYSPDFKKGQSVKATTGAKSNAVAEQGI